MQLSYTLSERELTDATKLLVARTIRGNRRYTVQRVAVSAVVAIGASAYLFSSFRRTPLTVTPLLVFGVCLFLLTVAVYPLITRRNAVLNLRKAVQAGEFATVLGPQLLTLTSEHYSQRRGGTEVRIFWRDMQSIDALGSYILIPVQYDVTIVPRNAFADPAAAAQFVQQFTAYQQGARAAQPPLGMLGAEETENDARR